MVVIVEVVDDLSVLDVAVVNVAGLGGPLEVIELRVDILVFEPAFLVERSSQLVIASLDYVHLLVVPTPVSLLPGCHVDVVLPVLLFLFFLPAIHIHVVPILYLRLLR